ERLHDIAAACPRLYARLSRRGGAITKEIRMKNGMIAATAAMALAATGASAQQLQNPGLVYTSFNTTQLAQLAAEMGATFEMMTTNDGKAVVLIHSPEGDFFAVPAVCDGAACLGVELVAFFSGANPSLEQVNSFNAQLSFAKALVVENTLTLSRY